MALAEVGFENLEIRCIIGDLPLEREQEQLLLFTVHWSWDCTKVAKSDNLTDTVDYTAVAELCRKTAVEGRFNLIETLGEAVAEKLLHTFALQEVSITIRKPAALEQSFGSIIRLTRRAKKLCPSHS
jgi:dihydroneopterin aldolase